MAVEYPASLFRRFPDWGRLVGRDTDYEEALETV